MEAQGCRRRELRWQPCLFRGANYPQSFAFVFGGALGKGTSRYLVQRIVQTANTKLLTETEITIMNGDEHPEEIEMTDRRSSQTRRKRVGLVFSFIGAGAYAARFAKEIESEEKGFVSTGAWVAGSSC